MWHVPLWGDCLLEVPEAVPSAEPDMDIESPAVDAISIAGSSSAETLAYGPSVISVTDGEDGSLCDVANLLQSATHDVAELFSQPRLTARAQHFGLQPGQHFDLATGADLATVHGRAAVWAYLEKFKPKCVVVSPPCTCFSQLMASNKSRMDPKTYASKYALGVSLLSFAMGVCKFQHSQGRLFLHEHPSAATSWGTPCVDEVRGLPGVSEAVFDQCCFGLTAPWTGEPMKKKTTLMHNIPPVQQMFDGRMCCCKPGAHRTIQSTHMGVKLSLHSQVYPPPLCDAILLCLQRHLQSLEAVPEAVPRLAVPEAVPR